MRVVAQLAEFWKNFGPDKHAACGQRPAWHDSVLSRALAKFTGSLSMVTTRHPGSHSSTLPVRDVTSRRGSRSTVLFQSFPPRFSASGEGKRENYRTNIWPIILSLFFWIVPRHEFNQFFPSIEVSMVVMLFLFFFYWNLLQN